MNPIKRSFSNIKLGVLQFLEDTLNKLAERWLQNCEAERKAAEQCLDMSDSAAEPEIISKVPNDKAAEPEANEEQQTNQSSEDAKPLTSKQSPMPRRCQEPMQGIAPIDEYILRKPESKPVLGERIQHAELVALADTKHLCAYSEDIELRPEEILLLDFIDGRSTDLWLPEYFTWKYKIDYRETFERFGKGGYLEYAPIEYSLSQQKKDTMQRLLVQQGLEPKGRKNELAKRLLEFSDLDILRQFQKSYFSVTEKGKDVISQNRYVFFFADHERVLDITILEAEKVIKARPTLSLAEVAIQILDERLCTYITQSDIMGMSFTIYRKGYVFELICDYVQAILAYIGSAYYDYLYHQLRNVMEFFAAYCTVDRLSGILRKNEDYRVHFDDLFSEALGIYIKLWQDINMPAVKHDVIDFYDIFTKELGIKN